MSDGYSRHPLLRMTPVNGTEEIVDMVAVFTDARGPVTVVEEARPVVSAREDVNRSSRPRYFGFKPRVRMTFQIIEMDDHEQLRQIVNRAASGDWTLSLSLDGGDSEYGVVFLDYTGPRPIRGKTVVGAEFTLTLEATDVLDESPAITQDVTTPLPLNPLLQALTALPAASTYPHRVFIYAPPGGSEEAVVSLWDNGTGAYVWASWARP